MHGVRVHLPEGLPRGVLRFAGRDLIYRTKLWMKSEILTLTGLNQGLLFVIVRFYRVGTYGASLSDVLDDVIWVDVFLL